MDDFNERMKAADETDESMNPRSMENEPALPRFSLKRRVTVLVIFLSMLVIGLVAAKRIPAELMPRGFEEDFLRVQAPWPDAPAREVMEKITEPLEEELGTIRGLRKLNSYSSRGSSSLFLSFKQGTDMDVAYREVRDRIERARRLFPDDVEKVYIHKFDTADIPIMVFGVAIDASITDAYDLIQQEVILPLSRIDGVANITGDGLEQKEVLIELDRERLSSSGVNLYELAQQLGDDNFTMASGHVLSDGRKMLLRSVARYDSVEALNDRLVTPSLRLGDIATIKYEIPEQRYRARAMSKPAIALIVRKEGDANTRAVSERVVAEFEKLQTNPRLSGLEMVVLFNQGDVIDEQLQTLIDSGKIGGVIAAGVLFLFLRRIRMTLIIALSIPLSMLIGLSVMYFGGETLNILTLLGLMISVGLLVDNSVVVAENIHRLHREGRSRRDAAIHGAGEISLAITLSTLTTLVVFLPIPVMEGQIRFFFARLAIPVCVSLAASLFVALVFIPLCVYLTLPTTSEAKAEVGLFRRLHQRVNDVLRRAYELTFGLLNRAYGRVMSWCLSHRLETLLAVLAVCALTFGPIKEQVEVVDQQEDEKAQFTIPVEMPPGTTLEEAEEWFLAAEKVVEEGREEWDLDGWFLVHDKSSGRIQGWFKRPRTKSIQAREVVKQVAEKLPKPPGVKLYIDEDSDVNQSRAESTYYVVIHGENPDQLAEVAETLESYYLQVDGVLGLRRRAGPSPGEIGLVIDRAKAQNVQANPRVIAGVVGYALRGTSLPRFYRDGRDIPVRIRFEEKDRESLTELADFAVPTDTGSFLPLGALTNVVRLEDEEGIFRRDKRISRTITLELESGKESETRRRLAMMKAGIDLPEGVIFGEDIQAQSFADDFAGARMGMMLSVAFIYLLMAFLFESFILPLSIIFTIPLAGIGVIWGHFLSGRNIDFLGFVGIIILVGVVVNNGIVLIDYVNRLRGRGRERKQAVLLAVERRFRPIMMTSITTIGGLIPLTMAGAGSIGISYTSFSLTLIGGMATATILTLLIVPTLYTLFDDLRHRSLEIGAAAARALGVALRRFVPSR